METIDIQIKSNIPETTKETTGLRQQVKELRKEMESCEVGSDEYNAALQRLANTTHELRDQQELVKNSSGDLGTVLSNLATTSTNIVSGFSAVSAVTTLLGGNNEELQKTMLKVQAAMQLVQGMKGFEGLGKHLKASIISVKAFITQENAATKSTKALAASQNTNTVATKTATTAWNGFTKALIASGIGAIVVALGLLIAHLEDIVKWLGFGTKETVDYSESLDKLNTSYEEENRLLELQLNLDNARGASLEEQTEKRKELHEKQIKNLEALQSEIILEAKSYGNKKKHKERLEELRQKYEEVTAEIKKHTDAIDELDNKVQVNSINKANEAAKARMAAAKKAADEEIAEAKKAGKEAEKEAEKIVAAFKQAAGEISTVLNALRATSDVKEVSEADAFITVYGTDPSKFEKKLTGTFNALVRNAYEELRAEQDKQLKAAAGDVKKEKEIKEAFEKKFEEVSQIQRAFLYDNTDFGEEFGKALAEEVVEATTGGWVASLDAAKEISDEFTNRFNALNTLYKEGIIDYKEYYDTLLNIQEEYEVKKADYIAQYGEEDQARMFELQLKPLALQKEVGEKFLAELDKQLADIDSKSTTFWNDYYRQQVDEVKKTVGIQTTWAENWKAFYGQTLADKYEAQYKSLEADKLQYDKEYTLRKEAIEKMLMQDGLTVEQKQQLNDQLAQLNNEKLQNDLEYYEAKKAADAEYVESFKTAMFEQVSALTDLGNALADHYKEAAESMKDSEGNYTKEGLKMLETSAVLQKATAIMQCAAGIATVWATSATLGPIAGPIVAGIQTAAHLVNLGTQLMSIDRALAAAKAGNSSTESTTSTPDTSFTLTSPDAYQTTLSDQTQTDLQANAQSNQRVYVVSSDISDAQEQNKTVVTTSTF